MDSVILTKGEFTLTCCNADGTVAWKNVFHNGVTLAGLDYLAQVGFTGGAQATTWYAGVVNNVSFAQLQPTDTMSAHTGWIEFTGYSGNRPTWTNAENSQTVASNGPFTFPITANGIINGLFIANNATVGGTSGTLWAHGLLPTPTVVTVGQSLTGTYSASFAGG